MSVLVPSLSNNHHHHHHSPYFPTMNNNNTNHSNNRRLHATNPSNKSNSLASMKPTENDQDSDHVPFGVVNSMKQRLLNKVNESYLLNQSSTLAPRLSLSKPSSRQPSNENLLQTKTLPSPLKRTTRLSRSQDNLSTGQPQTAVTEPFTCYLQPKHEVIIVDTTTTTTTHSQDYENETITIVLDDDHQDDGKLRSGQNNALHRHSYTELHRDEAPKPGTVTTVKKMFERQIRLSRYDADKLLTNTTTGSSRVSSQHRDLPSPTRSRSMSPNDMALRQRRTVLNGTTLPSSSTALSVPVPSSYPDLVISHTPPTEPSKTSNESLLLINTHAESLTANHHHHQTINKDKKLFIPIRNSMPHEQHVPLTVIVDDNAFNTSHQQRPNLLLPSRLSETVDSQPLDFKSRLALFNRTSTMPSAHENTSTNKKSFSTTTPITATTTNSSSSTNLLTKSTNHQQQQVRPVIEEKKENPSETTMPNHLLSMSIARSVINPAKAVTFFGGNKLNGNNKSSLPQSIPPPPAPIPSKSESPTIDLFRSPDIIGGNVKLNKSSIFSGAKKDARVQFIENVDTFEYPSFEFAMAELGTTASDDEQNHLNDDDDDDESSSASSNHVDENIQLKSINHEKSSIELMNNQDDVDDDELERLARINAKYNANNSSTEKPLKPKGTLHTFRPTHLDQYELGTQHGSMFPSKSSDMTSSPANAYSLLARQKLLASTDNHSMKNFTSHSLVKQTKANFDLTTNIQWSSMSTTTDLLF